MITEIQHDQILGVCQGNLDESLTWVHSLSHLMYLCCFSCCPVSFSMLSWLFVVDGGIGVGAITGADKATAIQLIHRVLFLLHGVPH